MTDPQLDAAEAAFRAAYLDPGLMRHALRKALEAADKAAWQPMATAPKDGRPVLAYLPKSVHGDAETFIDWFDAENGGWCEGMIVWRPLPTPPESAP